MSLRHLARQVVVQSLFTWDFYKQDADRVEEFFQWNIDRHESTIVDIEFPKETYLGVIKKASVIDEIIVKAAPQWPLEKIAAVDRNILRLGIYEMLFAENSDVPPRVAINEAIELGKSFGGPNTYKFISGVLGSIYEASDLKVNDTFKKGEEDPEKFPVVKKAGAVVYSENEEGKLVLGFVHDIFGKWTLSKGGAKDDETPEQACTRAIKEEMGVELTIEHEIQENEYIARHPKMGKVRKQVTYYIGRAPYGPLQVEEGNDGLDDAKWFTMEEFENMTTYDDIKPVVIKALKMVTE